MTQGSITVQQGLTVAPGQTLPITISVGPTAAVNDVTITLVSSDTTKLTVTPSIVIPKGSTTATTPAQVTGVNFGSATITASATGYVSDSQTVNVAANLSFSPPTVTVGTGGTTNLTLTLSGAAPAGGVVVTLTSDNTSCRYCSAKCDDPAEPEHGDRNRHRSGSRDGADHREFERGGYHQRYCNR